MKAVMSDVPADILAWRKKTGADMFDEVWEGVLHMTPSPNRDYQDLVAELLIWLSAHWAKPRGGCVRFQFNVAEPGTWPKNYRIPDLLLLTPERFHLDGDEFVNGGPDVVIEIRSPDDESYDKLPFYAKIGVREVWIIDRDTKRAEIYAVVGDACRPVSGSADGWQSSAAAGVDMKPTSDGKLSIRLAGRPETSAQLGT